jgi:hypothetical protein
MSKAGIRIVGGLLLLGLLGACATPIPEPRRYELFMVAPADDFWQPRIRLWQVAHGREPRVEAPAPVDVPLAQSFSSFARGIRFEVVERAVAWVQQQSALYYREDGEHDHWPTVREVLLSGGDDCDGLDALTFELLRGLGFRKGEIYRAIVVERGSGYHHMVTLWFPDPGTRDPYVLDPTAWVTRAVVPLSTLEGWMPLALFDETEQFRAAPAAPGVVAGPR